MSVEYNPNKLGWPFAGVVVVLTLGLLFGSYTVHKRTYRHPRDPMATQVYHARDAAGGAHGAAAAPAHAAPAHGAPAAAPSGGH